MKENTNLEELGENNTKYIVEILSSIFTKDSNVLELGSEFNLISLDLKSKVKSISKINSSIKPLEEVKPSHSKLSNNLYNDIFPDFSELVIDKFEGAFSIATLMHLRAEDINKTMHVLSKKLKSNSKFFLSVAINRNDIDGQGYDNKGKWFNLIDESGWKYLVEKNGFKAIESKIFNDLLQKTEIKWLNITFEKI